jgi:hypothetical protein
LEEAVDPIILRQLFGLHHIGPRLAFSQGWSAGLSKRIFVFYDIPSVSLGSHIPVAVAVAVDTTRRANSVAADGIDNRERGELAEVPAELLEKSSQSKP